MSADTDGLRLSQGSVVALFVSALLTLSVFAGSSRQAAVASLETMPRRAYVESYMLPRPEMLELASLGHNQMMADLIWVRAISYFAVHFYLDRDYRWLDRYIDSVIELDPDFRLIYQWAGVVVMYGGNQIDNHAVMASNRFLELGRQRYPDDWLFSFMLGCNYRYELVPSTPEEERAWRLLGATYLSRAAEQPDAPSWLAMTALRNLEAYGAVDEATIVGSQAFLTPRGVLSATLRAESQLHQHHPSYGGRSDLGLRSLVATGLTLTQRLSAVGWWRLFHYRRQLFADLDTADGYLPWEVRLLVRGGPEARAVPTWTPVDKAFYPTLRLLQEAP